MTLQRSDLGRLCVVHHPGQIGGTWGARSLAKERAHGLPGAVIVRGHEVRVASEDDFLGVPEVRRYLSERDAMRQPHRRGSVTKNMAASPGAGTPAPAAGRAFSTRYTGETPLAYRQQVLAPRPHHHPTWA